MTKVKPYNKTKTYMFPNGKLATPEVVKAEYPAAFVFDHLIYTDEAEQVIFSIMSIAATRSHYNIDSNVSDSEALALIETIINTKDEETVTEPSATDRIAAALEFQNLMAMPDAEEV